MFKALLSHLLAFTATLAFSARADSVTTPGGRIPRADFVGDLVRDYARISPDGMHLAFLAPYDGVVNVWVAPRGNLDAATAVTRDSKRGIQDFWWTRDSSHILYRQDVGGDENWRIYLTQIETRATQALSPQGKFQALIEVISVTKPDDILISCNDRDARYRDLYRVNLTTGARTLVFKNEGYASFIADDSLAVRLASRQTAAGGIEMFRVDARRKVEAKPFIQISAADTETTRVLGFDVTAKRLYLLDSRGRDKAALATVDLKTGMTHLLAESAKADVQDPLRHPTTGRVQAVAAQYLRQEWLVVDAAIATDIAFLNRETRGMWHVQSRSDDDRFWIVHVDPMSAPEIFWLYDRRAKTLAKLFNTRPNLEGAVLGSVYPVEIKARDGLTLPSYVTLPPGSDANGDGKPDKALPMVLWVHGGPWARDHGGFNPANQWLANRGYAVLGVNYRGSAGFGKSFIEKATHEFAGKMHDDLIDGVDWAIATGIAQPDRIAIVGGSYGGYATLVGMTFTPQKFACGVSIVGYASLVTVTQSFPEYWQPILESTWYRRAGDPRTPAGRKFLLERSPISRVDQIKRPLLISQGANDPRVTRKEADQLVAAMKAKNLPVTYLLYADEGHGWVRPQNRVSFFAIAENFLGQCLDVRSEPIGNDLEGAALTVPEGAADIPGLEAALSRTNQSGASSSRPSLQ